MTDFENLKLQSLKKNDIQYFQNALRFSGNSTSKINWKYCRRKNKFG